MVDQRPPLSQEEFQALLSQYLDGTLTDDEKRTVQLLLETHPDYQKEYSRLLQLRGTIGQLQRNLEPGKDGPDLWQDISQQLAADRQAPVGQYDFEFISAYYDNQVSRTDPERQAFEAQLYNNDDASRTLGEIDQLSTALRGYGHRLEENCTFEASARVMAAYRGETGGVAAARPSDESIDPVLADLSAYADQELSGKDVIRVNRLLETDPQLKRTLIFYNLLSDRMRFIHHALVEQAPDLWPALAPEVAQIAEENRQKGKTILPFSRPVVAVSAMAAAVLLLFMMAPLGSLLQPGQPNTPVDEVFLANNPATTGYGVVGLEGGSLLQRADYRHKPERQLAALPSMSISPQASDSREADIAIATEAISLEDAAPAAPAAATEPVEMAANRTNTRPNGLSAGLTAPARQRANIAIPSSEAYLFRRLKEDMGDDAVEVLMQL